MIKVASFVILFMFDPIDRQRGPKLRKNEENFFLKVAPPTTTTKKKIITDKKKTSNLFFNFILFTTFFVGVGNWPFLYQIKASIKNNNLWYETPEMAYIMVLNY